MVWSGFLKESKSFICYDSLSILGKMKFWIKYPKAYWKYFKLMYLDERVKRMLVWRKQAEEERV